MRSGIYLALDLAFFLTVYVAFYLAFCLALSDILSEVKSGILSDILPAFEYGEEAGVCPGCAGLVGLWVGRVGKVCTVYPW
jgi:hypothetical protein